MGPMLPILRVLALACLALLPVQAEETLAVAAAADLRGAWERLGPAFEARHPGLRVQVSFAASGTLSAQIRQGAPFDVFLSADLAFPARLAEEGLGSPEGVFPYALGRLALWVRSDLGLDPARLGFGTLGSPKVRRVVLANPRVAPYGRAAEEALRHAGLLEALAPRLVFAENVAQAGQYLRTGAADAGLVSLSQAEQPDLKAKGFAWTLPAGTHAPLRQGGLVLKRSAAPRAAQALRAFLLGAEGQALLAASGFGKP